jgi:Transcriptional regulators containing a DNA-binding HTH domain and an aminotransferase domain (MocR family) and their eukaryotic orthologs
MQYTFSHHASQVQGSAIRDLLSVINNPAVVSLAGGNPSPATFPEETLAALSQTAILEHGSAVLQYGATEGVMALRESCNALNHKRGIRSEVKNIIPTAGSTQGIDLISKIFLDDGDTVLTERPTFLGALQTFYMYGANVMGVANDANGLDLVDLEEKMKKHRPKFFYVIPNFQNPSGRTWSLDERKNVLALAEKYDVMILEDDPYGELRYEGVPIAPIQQFDQQGHVVHLSSFSKTICPGLRVGYTTADPSIIHKMFVAKQGVDVMTSSLSQVLVDGFLRSGQYAEHVANNCRFYRAQMLGMLEAIDEYFPKEVSIVRPQGGLFLWVELPESIDADALSYEAMERGVAYVPGEHFFPDEAKKNTLRLNFSLETVPNIRIGIERLGKLLNEKLT